MKQYAYILIAALAGCTSGPSPVTEPIPEARILTSAGVMATDPYFTSDQYGNPVLSWTEQLPGSEDYLLKYAVFDPSEGSFGPAVSVTTSAGTNTTAESANKVAFKSDGTIIALFGKRFNDPENRFAGAIQYSLSTNDGTTWSAPRYLHSDTLHQYGRSFFDMATLSNGEVGAIWLDGRYGEADTGSALFFASTIPEGGFGMDKMIGESTCECCRTDLLVDSAGRIHVAYRDILYPPSYFGKQVRDMVYSASLDTGRTFSAPVRISVDNWEIEGCPHSGPSLAVTQAGIQAVWFTAGPGSNSHPLMQSSSAAGIYQTILPLAGKTPEEQAACIAAAPSRALMKRKQGFSARELVDSSGRHPQLISLPGGGTALVVEQPDRNIPPEEAAGTAQTKSGGNAAHAGKAMTGHSGHGQAGASGTSTIVLRLNKPGKDPVLIQLTDGTGYAHHPVLAVPEAGMLLTAWVQENDGAPGIRYSLTRW